MYTSAGLLKVNLLVFQQTSPHIFQVQIRDTKVSLVGTSAVTKKLLLSTKSLLNNWFTTMTTKSEYYKILIKYIIVYLNMVVTYKNIILIPSYINFSSPIITKLNLRSLSCWAWDDLNNGFTLSQHQCRVAFKT